MESIRVSTSRKDLFPTLYEQEEKACLSRCQWRKLYEEYAGHPPDNFTYEDCKTIAEETKLSGLDRCGLAAVCVAFTAREDGIDA
jgi:hypothetical protein